MSGGIVHEISQPLAAIRNYAYALKVSLGLRDANPEQHAIAERLGEEADRAIEVVRNVRRMGPQQAEDSGVCDINEVIAHSIRLAALGVEPPPPVTVTSEAEGVLVAGSLPMIGQVVVNLLKNALSASMAAGRAGAEVKVTLREDSAEVAVADFGAGVPAEAAGTMFAPFVKSARGGMGLGLSICQRIADSLGGSLSWENSSTAGAIFRFTVPLARQGVTS
jgi:C4-dicarboxylate-specific signal transduction histidine kinase